VDFSNRDDFEQEFWLNSFLITIALCVAGSSMENQGKLLRMRILVIFSSNYGFSTFNKYAKA